MVKAEELFYKTLRAVVNELIQTKEGKVEEVVGPTKITGYWIAFQNTLRIDIRRVEPVTNPPLTSPNRDGS